jgi:hypothetical protein
MTKSKNTRFYALSLATIFMWEIIFPTASYALTGGPSQPEVQSFEPLGTTEMVDLFSGDFVYNIPLMDVEGFPINISYHSGIGMDAEASWVGLGWNISPGAINRTLRGLPDDFDGEEISKTTHVKDNYHVGVAGDFAFEAAGLKTAKVGKNIKKLFGKAIGKKNLDGPQIHYTLGINYNSYKGMGYEISITPALSSFNKNSQFKATPSISFKLSSADGMSVDPSLKLGFGDENKNHFGLTAGASIGSMSGLKNITIGYSYSSKSSEANRALSEAHLANNSSSISFNPIQYSPQIGNTYNSYSMNAFYKFGGAFTAVSGSYNLSANFSNQVLKNNNEEVKTQAFGYLYSQNKQYGDQLLDYSREKDGMYQTGVTNLPVPTAAYDLFNISGEGIGGMFRAQRNDYGVITDPIKTSNTVGFSGGYEVEPGPHPKWGIYTTCNWGTSGTSGWSPEPIQPYAYSNTNSGDAQPVYFKSVGEKVPMDESYMNNVLGADPVACQVDKTTGIIGGVMTSEKSGQTTLKTLPQRKRTIQGQSITYLTEKEAQYFALDKEISIYKSSTFEIDNTNSNANLVYRTLKSESKAQRKQSTNGNRISEVTVTKPDGKRYIYGIPAMNNLQKEISFNIGKADKNGENATQKDKGLVTYSATEKSVNNNEGEDQFYSSTTTPAYAHSYLLTAIVSADYVDVLGDGITDDDLGTAIKLNYSRVPNYKWRVPYGNEANIANYNKGYLSDEYDDKASIIYGEKDLWFLHSVETKNMVACFYTNTRADGKGVDNEDGGRSATTAGTPRLNQIKLFTKAALISGPANAVPIKVVNFDYDYSLCQGVDNNLDVGGKLTLKKISFTYGTSQKGSMNPYIFDYDTKKSDGSNDLTKNPDYNLRGYDRWGNYKPNAPASALTPAGILDPAAKLSNEDDPYVPQSAEADEYAQVWSLKTITLPSGGTIKVEYESDDYAYVQDQRVGQMFKVVGAGNDLTDSKNPSDRLYQFDHISIFPGNLDINNRYLFFSLGKQEHITSADMAMYKKRYFDGIENIYFKFLVDITNQGDNEFVNGYLNQDDYGFVRSQNLNTADEYDLGYIRIRNEMVTENPLLMLGAPNDVEVHPVALAAWYKMYMEMPKKLKKMYMNPTESDGDPAKFKANFGELLGSLNSTVNFLTGMFHFFKLSSAGKSFIPNKSFLRLNNPELNRKGGGCRVKKISMSDGWKGMIDNSQSSTGRTAEYGQEFDYTTEGISELGLTKISSGVATYEPANGDDENAMKRPVYYSKKVKMAPDLRYMSEIPLGESYYPAPSVGYSKVKVKNIMPAANIVRSSTGYTITEYYTAKEFPVIVQNTQLRSNDDPSKFGKFFAGLFRMSTSDNKHTSQGYSITLNDMHGKMKSQRVYNAYDIAISGSDYTYNVTTDANTKKATLNNQVSVLNPSNGFIQQKTIGVDFDMITDSRCFQSEQNTLNINFNNDVILTPVPIPLFTLFPVVETHADEYGSVVTNKVINQFGILKSVTAFDGASSVKTENMLWDNVTGEVLLTKTYNEFDKPIFNYTYKAHLVYEGMGPASKNVGNYLSDVRWSSKGVFYDATNSSTQTFATSWLVPGDEVCLIQTEKVNPTPSIVPEKYWVVKHPVNGLMIMDRTGKPPVYNTEIVKQMDLKVIRSGRRNMSSVELGKISQMVDPVGGTSNQVTLTFNAAKRVINASANEYNDSWKISPYQFKYYRTKPLTESDLYLDSNCVGTAAQTAYKELDKFINRQIIDNVNGVNGKNTYSDIDLSACSYFASVAGTECYDFKAADNILEIVKYEPLHFNKTYTTCGYQITVRFGNSSRYLVKAFAYTKTGSSSLPALINDQSNSNPKPYALRRLYNSVDYQDNGQLYVGTACNGSSGKAAFEYKYPDGNAPNYNSNSTTAPNGAHVWVKITSWPSCSKDLITPFVANCNCITTDPPAPQIDPVCFNWYQSESINPYIVGLKGNWRPWKSYTFLDNRLNHNQSGSKSNLSAGEGHFGTFCDFQNRPNAGRIYWDKSQIGTPNLDKWKCTNEVTQYDVKGNEIENKNPLDVYSSVLYNYTNGLNSAVANNAKKRQIAMDGFEDYNFYSTPRYDHFSFHQSVGGSLNEFHPPHTGGQCFQVDAGSTNVIETKYITKLETITAATPSSTIDHLYNTKPSDYIEEFSPDAGNYIVSGWVSAKDQPMLGDNANFTNQSIKVIIKDINGVETSTDVHASGPVIEGWQRVWGSFTVPDNAECIKVQLLSPNERGWFDDIRIQPATSTMKTFAYDPLTHRLTAQLDENNYATFYEYDPEGRLVRIKRETERGIVTIQESRTGMKKPQ